MGKRGELVLTAMIFLISVLPRPSISNRAFFDITCESENCVDTLRHKVLEERGDSRVRKLAVSWGENGTDEMRGACKGATLTLLDEGGEAEGVWISFEVDNLTMGQNAGRAIVTIDEKPVAVCHSQRCRVWMPTSLFRLGPSPPTSTEAHRISVSIGRRDSYHHNPLISSGGANSTFSLRLQREALDDEMAAGNGTVLALDRPGWASALTCHGKDDSREADEDGRNTAREHLAEAIAPITEEDIKTVLEEGINIHGSTTKVQHDFFCSLLQESPHITDVLEIGFNQGSFTQAVLGCRNDVRVVSFDMASQGHEITYWQQTQDLFPGRISLVLGKSQETVPVYGLHNPKNKFGLIFIDGGHSYGDAYIDLRNCALLAAPDAILVVDDYGGVERGATHDWEVGVRKAWDQAVEEGWVKQEGPVLEVPGNHPGNGDLDKGWVVGRYTAAEEETDDEDSTTVTSVRAEWLKGIPGFDIDA